MDKNIIVLGIDHGWSQMKTPNFVFTSGVKEITTEPSGLDNTVQYEGKYYRVGGNRLEVKETKVEDENYYILTLAAVAKELDIRGIRDAHLFLAVGLPIGRFGIEKEDFLKYLSKNKEVEFRFEGKRYHIVIDKVSVYPQCYGAIVQEIGKFPYKALVVDIGSWTIDMVPIVEKSADESVCITSPNGIITCMKRINEQCVRKLNGEVDEHFIQEVMRTGTADIGEDYLEIIRTEIESYCKRIFRSIGEAGYNLKTIPITFVGGGAVMMKRFGGLTQPNIRYIEDVKANAKGYEYLGRFYVKKMRKKYA